MRRSDSAGRVGYRTIAATASPRSDHAGPRLVQRLEVRHQRCSSAGCGPTIRGMSTPGLMALRVLDPRGEVVRRVGDRARPERSARCRDASGLGPLPLPASCLESRGRRASATEEACWPMVRAGSDADGRAPALRCQPLLVRAGASATTVIRMWACCVPQYWLHGPAKTPGTRASSHNELCCPGISRSSRRAPVPRGCE